MRDTDVRAGGMELDLSLPESPGLLLDAVGERLGAPSILVKNAVHFTRDGYETLDAAILDDHHAVNLRATALLCILFARCFKGETGRIINITSGQSLVPLSGERAYAATKGAIEAFTRTLAAEAGHKGITVNAVNRGPADTGWLPERLRGELSSKFPLGQGWRARGGGSARRYPGGRRGGVDHQPDYSLRRRLPPLLKPSGA